MVLVYNYYILLLA